ncbi:probable serine/threonine-protein kinase SIS8 [Carica papaya]|uniref:probable serine/threonine-protein kinase SIS8 n=1 Tax=Carica papaya TaxID=3649 RepID=UPI000B8D19E1|nr:probable serine/threonine-protein kinase SIS8 [Carica papaya]
MSKVKHLLRKLHIGGGFNEHQRLPEAARPVIGPRQRQSPSPSPNPSPTAASSASSSGSGTMGGTATVDSLRADRQAGAGMDFNFLEEEFQVQLALAISASDPDTRQDPETAQIDAAKRISLGCSPSDTDTNALVEFLSLRYWSYKVINYDEKVVDGFYDVYGITSHSISQGKMPSLVDIQAASISDSVDYEVILVNRLVDHELQELEKKAFSVSLESRVFEHRLVSCGLIQKIADIVVDKMGGPVADADEMLRRWTLRSYELRNSLNTIILPLGLLDVGLSRHRALLFKVLADRINLPCMLVKGSYYTGTDDGAVNLIKIDNGSEYILDLMGAPGTLIPAEVPSSQLSNAGLGLRGFAGYLDTSLGPSEGLDNRIGTSTVSSSFNKDTDTSTSKMDGMHDESYTSQAEKNTGEKNQTEVVDHDAGKLIPSLSRSGETCSWVPGKTSSAQRSAQKMKVKNVSKYVISAAKDPEFAQKLHAVLLESGASPPPDLFVDINSQDFGEQNLLERVRQADRSYIDGRFDYDSNKTTERVDEHQRKLETNIIRSHVSSPSRTKSEEFLFVGNIVDERIRTEGTGLVDCCQQHFKNASVTDDKSLGRISDNNDSGKGSDWEAMEIANCSQSIISNGNSESINPVLRGVAEWEIPWDDLQLGERIGIGSYGEVYRAEWNGTEVAVKKFLDQDFSGDALVQFKSEVEIMLRLRHPNVVLFMGAVTRPPHFSILTEFLPRGSLYKLLHRPNPQLDEKRRMRMALDVAKGMNCLHTSHPPIVHRDLKSPNLLVDKNWVVKVCDFGLSRMKHHTFLSSKSTAGTVSPSETPPRFLCPAFSV